MIFSSTGSRLGKSGASETPRRLSIALSILGCLILASPAHAYAVPSPVQDASAPSAADAISAPTRLAQTQPAPLPTPLPTPAPARPAASPSPAPAGPAAPSPAASSPISAPADEPIGNVATLTGTATVIRNKASTPLKLQDDIFLNDILQTSTNSTLGITFNDATTFNLTANARITVDNYLYEDGGKQNNALFDITRGTVAFVAAAVAKTGDMRISTPTASLGIRGTTGLVEVPQDGAATGAHNIKLYPDPDGRVGHIDVSDHNGVRLGSLTQGASGFTIRPGAGGRITAAPLMISPREAARDQGIVRQVHAAQVVGRQVVTRQRALRQANPNRNNPRNNPAGQPGPQRQNNLQQRPNSLQPRPPQQPGSPNRPLQQGQPQQPHPPGLQPNAPGVRQPGAPNRPALQPKRPPAPRGKPPKEKKR
ncbi:MAG: iron dicitrate transport regulator FecR [Bradyrhizobium sp.]|jgi:hypothetical protein|uniref:FecR family protein n=1 Tax=Bradyrhizobium sp. TaxID=376 RepID=UPI00120C1A3D|nr:MAG: iron dicitrate transport regulator FecR [Bradyrhizobium sp.]